MHGLIRIAHKYVRAPVARVRAFACARVCVGVAVGRAQGIVYVARRDSRQDNAHDQDINPVQCDRMDDCVHQETAADPPGPAACPSALAPLRPPASQTPETNPSTAPCDHTVCRIRRK